MSGPDGAEVARRAVLLGAGAALPPGEVTNDDLAQRVDTSDAWIRERTGIEARRIAGNDQRTSDLAAEAGRAALADAALTPDDIDLVVVGTATPDLTFPATAAITQGKLGITRGAAFDVHAVCTGFVYALSTATAFLETGQHRRALVIGAETFSRIVDWEDRSTCVLFGDGAGAWVLEARDVPQGEAHGVLASVLRCDGRLTDLLYVDGGPSATQTTGQLRMQGNKVFKEAVGRISDAMVTASEQSGVPLSEVDWFVPHQANQRIIGGVVKRLSLDAGKVVSTIARHGNTSAASIPLAFDVARQDGRIESGDTVMICGMGGGLTWGAAILTV